MKLILTATIAAALGLAACRAGTALDLDLETAWRNAMPSNSQTGSLGNITWVSLAFASNDVARWEWVRDGKQEIHSGSFRISAKPVPGGRSTISDVVIVPAAIAVSQPITLYGATIGGDSRFPALWVVLKWFDEAGNQMTFVRESEFAEWKEFLELLDKA